MATSTTPIFPQAIGTIAQTISVVGTPSLVLAGNATTGGNAANGVKIESLQAINTSGSAVDLTLVINTSTSASATPVQVVIQIPANAGTNNATPAVNLLTHANWPTPPVDVNGNKYVYVAANSALSAYAGTTSVIIVSGQYSAF
jgi:hypothetical protein